MTVRSRGFTLIELLVVIAIISILTAVGTVSYGNAQTKGRDARRKSDLKQIQAALELYKADNGQYPSSMGAGEKNWWELSNPVTPTDSWIRDDQASPNIYLAPQYMQTVPKDPINTSTAANYGPFYTANNYAYYSGNSLVNGVACNGGQYYWLVAYLENSNDPDRLAVTKVKSCGYDLSTLWSGNAYVLVNP